MSAQFVCRIAFPVVAAAVTAHGATIATADFTGMSVTDQATVSPVAGANDFTWSPINTGVNFDVVTDDGTPGIGGGNALRIDQSGTGTFRGMTGTLGSTASLAVGEALALSFSGRYYESPSNNSGGLRFGFINPDDPDNNFYAQLGTGGNASFGIYRDAGGDDSPGAGTTINLGATASGSSYASLATDPFVGTFTITRSDVSEYQIVAEVNGAIRTATSTIGWNEYGAIFVRNGGVSADFLVDNVTVTQVPEPSAALLGALGLVGLLLRRR